MKHLFLDTHSAVCSSPPVTVPHLVLQTARWPVLQLTDWQSSIVLGISHILFKYPTFRLDITFCTWPFIMMLSVYAVCLKKNIYMHVHMVYFAAIVRLSIALDGWKKRADEGRYVSVFWERTYVKYLFFFNKFFQVFFQPTPCHYIPVSWPLKTQGCNS